MFRELWSSRVRSKLGFYDKNDRKFEVDFTWIFRKSKRFSVCLNIICTARRAVLIQRVLCSPDLEECFRYPEHVCNMSRKFPRGLWRSRVCSKKGVEKTRRKSFESWFYMDFSKILKIFCFLQNNMLLYAPRTARHWFKVRCVPLI